LRAGLLLGYPTLVSRSFGRRPSTSSYVQFLRASPSSPSPFVHPSSSILLHPHTQSSLHDRPPSSSTIFQDQRSLPSPAISPLQSPSELGAHVDHTSPLHSPLRRIEKAGSARHLSRYQRPSRPTVYDNIKPAHIRPLARPHPELLDSSDTPAMRRQVASGRCAPEGGRIRSRSTSLSRSRCFINMF